MESGSFIIIRNWFMEVGFGDPQTIINENDAGSEKDNNSNEY